MFVNIHLYSKNYLSLNAFMNFFLKFHKEKSINTNYSPVQYSKPKITKKFTVLKSPHVNKKAQEQFEYRLHKRQISFYWFQSFKMLMLLKKVQTKLFPDVKIKIRFMLNTSKIKKVSQQKLNPNNLSLVKNCEKKVKSKVYLKLLDVYGEANFKNCRMTLEKIV